MRLIGYTRVSTAGQAEDGVSLSMQAARIAAYCEANGHELTDIVSDRGVSAKDIRGREGFQSALEMVLHGDADGLVLLKLDRGFRSTRDALATAERLAKQGKVLVSVCENIDTSTPQGEFTYTLLASIGQLERKMIAERTKSALAEKRRNGEKLGGHTPFGYRAEHGKLVQDETEQQVIHHIGELKRKGYSSRKIAQTLNADGYTTRKGTPWSHTLILRILRQAA